MDATIALDVVIFGGGCAGLWLLDELRRRGQRVLLIESGELGGAQTTASQGILHGGVKYVLSGLRSASASSIRDMPGQWRQSLSGQSEPDLSSTRIRSESCFLWRSDSWQSWAGLLGARAFLEVKPVVATAEELPPVLRRCPGQVFRLDEEVIDTVSFVKAFQTRNRGLLLRAAPRNVSLSRDSSGQPLIQLTNPDTAQQLCLHPRYLVLAAGTGNESLREQLGLSSTVAQRRPLHMVLARGPLPFLNGHCVDGAKTRITITSDLTADQQTVWQIGGQIAEDGVSFSSVDLIQRAIKELTAVLPGWSPEGVEWSTYRVDRAERSMSDGARPDDVQIIRDAEILTIWPTKLVLAPRMAERVISELALTPGNGFGQVQSELQPFHWPEPALAKPVWERQDAWITVN